MSARNIPFEFRIKNLISGKDSSWQAFTYSEALQYYNSSQQDVDRLGARLKIGTNAPSEYLMEKREKKGFWLSPPQEKIYLESSG